MIDSHNDEGYWKQCYRAWKQKSVKTLHIQNSFTANYSKCSPAWLPVLNNVATALRHKLATVNMLYNIDVHVCWCLWLWLASRRPVLPDTRPVDITAQWTRRVVGFSDQPHNSNWLNSWVPTYLIIHGSLLNRFWTRQHPSLQIYTDEALSNHLSVNATKSRPKSTKASINKIWRQSAITSSCNVACKWLETTLWFKKTRQLWRTITTTQFSRF